jgi:murein DD-endopeptidase MepM/ murein hydrolase activator NlpD
MRRSPRRSIRTLTLALAAVASTAFLGLPEAGAAGTVAGTVSVAKGSLTVRADASSRSAKVGSLGNKAKVGIVCQVTGEYVKGRVRNTNKWDRLGTGRYIADAYVKRNTAVAVPACPPPAPAPAPSLTPPLIDLELTKGDWVIPVPKVPALGGFRTPARPEHDGVDISVARHTPIRSVAAGMVVTVKCNTSGPSCDVDGSPQTTGCGWYVQVLHVDDVVTRYCHMVRQPEVAVGDEVAMGQIIGYVGTSGHSSGPHLHFEVHLGHPAVRANAVDPVQFMQQAGAPLN